MSAGIPTITITGGTRASLWVLDTMEDTMEDTVAGTVDMVAGTEGTGIGTVGMEGFMVAATAGSMAVVDSAVVVSAEAEVAVVDFMAVVAVVAFIIEP